MVAWFIWEIILAHYIHCTYVIIMIRHHQDPCDSTSTMECHKGFEIEHCSFQRRACKCVATSSTAKADDKCLICDSEIACSFLAIGARRKAFGWRSFVKAKIKTVEYIQTYSVVFKPNILKTYLKHIQTKQIHNKLRLWRTQGIIHATKHVSKLLTGKKTLKWHMALDMLFVEPFLRLARFVAFPWLSSLSTLQLSTSSRNWQPVRICTL